MPYFVGSDPECMGEVENQRSFDGQLCEEYSCQKLLKSDHPISSYNQKCCGCFIGTQCMSR